MPAYMTSFKSGATPTAVKASVIIPTKNPGRSFAAFCLQCSRRKPASASTSWSSIRVLRTARSNLCAALRINACVSWKFRRPNLATARRAIWPFRKPPANTQCSSLMMHSRTICIGLLPWWPWPIQTPESPACSGAIVRTRRPAPTPNAIWTGTLAILPDSPWSGSTTRPAMTVTSPTASACTSSRTTTRWCVDPCGNRFPIPMSILPRIRSGPSKSSKPDGKGLCA